MKSFLSNIYSGLCLTFVILLLIILTPLSILSLAFNPQGDFSFFIMKLWSKLILWFCRIKITVIDIDNINKKNVQIFASNHLSQFDICVLSAIIPVKFAWVAKKELFKIPFLGWHLKANNYISVERDNPKKALKSLHEAAKQVKNGKRIVIFPEGTRSTSGELQPFKKGLFHLCARSGVPIIPICIDGTFNILRPGSLKLHPGKVFVKFGNEIHIEGHSVKNVKTLMNELRDSILQLQTEIREIKSLKEV